MKTAKIQVILWFFLVVASLLLWKVYSAKSDLQVLAETGVKDEVLAFIRQQNAGLLEDKTKLQREEIALKLLNLKKYQAKAQLDLQRVKLYSDIYMYGVIFLIGSAGLSGIILAIGFHRERVKRASVHTYQLGQHNMIVVHERDLSIAAPVAMGLVNAQELKQINGGVDKALSLYKSIADVQQGKLSAIAQAELATQETIDIPMRVKTFRELLESGEIAQGKPMILADHDGELLRGSWMDLFSCAVGGQAGSGKTGTLRSYVAQSVLQGYRLWIIDPHYPHQESLQASLQPFIGRGLVNVGLPVEICEEVNRTIVDRLQMKESSRIPAILVIDEVLDVMTNCPGAAQIIEKIGTQGRKCQVYGLFAGHSLLAAKTGGNSALRDNLTAKICHHMEKKQAKVLIDDNETAKQVQKLKAGEAFLKVVGKEPIAVKIHECVPSDVFRVAEILRVANDNFGESEKNLQVDDMQKKQTQDVVSCSVSDDVSIIETQKHTECLNSETQAENTCTHAHTWLEDFMEKNAISRKEIADVCKVSLALVDFWRSGERKLTMERKMQLEKYFAGQNEASNVIQISKKVR